MLAFLRKLVAVATPYLASLRRLSSILPSRKKLFGNAAPVEEASSGPDQCVKTAAVLVEIHGISTLSQALLRLLPGIRHIPSLINLPFCGRGKLHIRWKPRSDFAPDDSSHTFLLTNIGEIKLFFKTLALINHVWQYSTPECNVPDIRYDLELELAFQQFAEEAHLTTTRQELKLAKIIAGYLAGHHNFIVTGTSNQQLIARLEQKARSPHYLSVQDMIIDIVRALKHGHKQQ